MLLGPVVCGLSEAGFFELFKQKEALPEAKILQSLKPNVGHFNVAMRMLDSLGWLEREHGQYRLLCSKAIWQKISKQFLLNLNHTAQLDFAHELFTEEVSQKVWQPVITQSLQARSDKEDDWQDYLDGSWLVPLLISLDQKGCFKDLSAELFTNLPHIQESLSDYCVAQKWCVKTKQGVVATEMGRYVFERIQLMSTVFSYRSMLLGMPELLFGDAAGVFKRDTLGDECHVDRSLNVIGSGFSHQKYFKDLESLIIEIFNHPSLQSQPKVIADTGCGDGSLLKRLHDVILKETLRGQNLSEYPLSLVGIDYNQSALDETIKTLDGYPHHAVQGDIGDPVQLLKDIEALGFIKDDILHVRSFLDHDRPYQAPEADDYSYHVNEDDSGVYVRSDGSLIDSGDMMQSTVEHFARWKEIVGHHGLISLEVHSLDPKTVHDHLDQTENLHFDAYHAFSSQYLMKAEQMIQAAAGGGFMRDRTLSRVYPFTLPYTRITLSYFRVSDCSIVSFLPKQAIDFIEDSGQFSKKVIENLRAVAGLSTIVYFSIHDTAVEEGLFLNESEHDITILAQVMFSENNYDPYLLQSYFDFFSLKNGVIPNIQVSEKGILESLDCCQFSKHYMIKNSDFSFSKEVCYPEEELADIAVLLLVKELSMILARRSLRPHESS